MEPLPRHSLPTLDPAIPPWQNVHSIRSATSHYFCRLSFLVVLRCHCPCRRFENINLPRSDRQCHPGSPLPPRSSWFRFSRKRVRIPCERSTLQLTTSLGFSPVHSQLWISTRPRALWLAFQVFFDQAGNSLFKLLQASRGRHHSFRPTYEPAYTCPVVHTERDTIYLLALRGKGGRMSSW
jgi:hypothetical protein